MTPPLVERIGQWARAAVGRGAPEAGTPTSRGVGPGSASMAG